MTTRFYIPGELLVRADRAETQFKNMGIMSAYKTPGNSHVVWATHSHLVPSRLKLANHHHDVYHA